MPKRQDLVLEFCVRYIHFTSVSFNEYFSIISCCVLNHVGKNLLATYAASTVGNRHTHDS